MEVYALVGKAGTGKSHRALNVALENGIETIIDDGLLIQKNHLIAGQSAKAERTVSGAVKRAIFADPNHALEVKKALLDLEPDKVLVLGTSEKMIGRIVEALHLPEPVHVFDIGDVSSRGEIERALGKRNNEGKHVIPVPTIQVKEKLPGIWLAPLEVFRKNKADADEKIGEKTIVRPPFSALGKVLVSPRVIEDTARFVAGKFPWITKTSRTSTAMRDGIYIEIEVHARYSRDLISSIERLQRAISEEIEYLTLLDVKSVNVTLKTINFNGRD